MKRPALSLDYLHKKEHVDMKVNFDLKSLYSNPTVSIVGTNETTLANFCAKNTIETAKICSIIIFANKEKQHMYGQLL